MYYVVILIILIINSLIIKSLITLAKWEILGLKCAVKYVNQRIYKYIEFKATPLRLCSGDYCPRKQEQELQRTYRQHGELFLQGVESSMQVYTVGWVDFGLFSQIYAFACCLQFPQVQYSKPPNFFDFVSKTNEHSWAQLNENLAAEER